MTGFLPLHLLRPGMAGFLPLRFLRPGMTGFLPLRLLRPGMTGFLPLRLLRPGMAGFPPLRFLHANFPALPPGFLLRPGIKRHPLFHLLLWIIRTYPRHRPYHKLEKLLFFQPESQPVPLSIQFYNTFSSSVPPSNLHSHPQTSQAYIPVHVYILYPLSTLRLHPAASFSD